MRAANEAVSSSSVNPQSSGRFINQFGPHEFCCLGTFALLFHMSPLTEGESCSKLCVFHKLFLGTMCIIDVAYQNPSASDGEHMTEQVKSTEDKYNASWYRRRLDKNIFLI